MPHDPHQEESNLSEPTIQIEPIPGQYAICRLPPDAPLPLWIPDSSPHSFLSITRTDQELSILLEEQHLPPNDPLPTERGYIGFRIIGPLPFTQIGILARITTALAQVKIPLLAQSTHDTDYLFLKSEHKDQAQTIFQKAGWIEHPRKVTPTSPPQSSDPPMP